MRLFRMFFSSFLLLLAFHATSIAQNSGLHILTVIPGSQSLSLNEAVTAELLGGSSLYSNPANLALEKSSNMNADYTLWVGGIKHTHAAVNFRKDNRALAFGFIGSQAGDIHLRGNQAGPSQGSFNISFLSLSGGYAYRFGPLALGGTIQYLREEYYIYQASGYAANLGTSLELWDGKLRLGSSLLNLGKMNELRNKATNLPTTLRAGFDAELLTFIPPQNNDLPITINLINDWVFPLNTVDYSTQNQITSKAYTNIALEFDIAETIRLRSGYKTGNTVRHWSFGAGFNLEPISADYAMVPFETGFGTVHSIGLQYDF